MNDHSQEPSGVSLGLTVILVIAGFLLFGGLLYYVYLPAREPANVTTPVFSAAEVAELDKLPAAEREAKLSELRWQRLVPTPEDRAARLAELRQKEAAALSSYSWVDQAQGVVRLPIDRAMELTLQELQRARGGNR